MATRVHGGLRSTPFGTGLLLLLPALAAAETVQAPIELGLPLACSPGRDCWIPRHVDVDPGPDFRDHACGSLSGPGHKGTDFAIPDLAAMQEGVPVVAAADGVVRGVRDGMVDADVSRIGSAAVEGRECGNGVAVVHEGGWETQYCHLRRGSVRVREGDRVRTGEPLGLVGLSGDTNFPHVHFTLRLADEVIDPFTGRPMGAGCAVEGAPLWRADLVPPLAYAPVVLTRIGVAGGPVAWEDVQQGGHAATALPVDADALVVWVEGFALRQGDVVRFKVSDSAGEAVFEDEGPATADKARFLRFAGRKAPPSGFERGTYTASVGLWRGGAALAERSLAFEIR